MLNPGLARMSVGTGTTVCNGDVAGMPAGVASWTGGRKVLDVCLSRK